MLRHSLQLFLRQLARHRLYSGINLLGLVLAMVGSFYLLHYVHHEYAYDAQHPNTSRTYRLNSHMSYPGSEIHAAIIPYALPDALEAEALASVEQMVVLRKLPDRARVVEREGQQLPLSQAYEASPNVFEMFRFTWLEGQPATALKPGKQVVLTQALAQNLFGREQDVLGEALTIDNETYRVAGLVKPKGPSHWQPTAIFSNPSLTNSDWSEHGLYTYVTLQPGTAPSVLQSTLDQLHATHMQPTIAENQGTGYFSMQAMGSIHGHSRLDFEMGPNGNATYTRVFLVFALLLLVIGAVNYVNLTVARSMQRGRELGVRKVLGAARQGLVGQFMGHALLYTLSALALALLLVYSFFPLFNSLAQTQLPMPHESPRLMVLYLALVLLLSGLAGAYPAWLINRFQPSQLMARKVRLGRGANLGMRGLVVFQLVITLFLLTSTLVTQRQLSYLKNKDLGYSPGQVVHMALEGHNRWQKLQTLRGELDQQPGIAAVGSSNQLPGSSMQRDYFSFEQGEGNATAFVQWATVDDGFVPAMDMALAEGRNFMPAGTEGIQMGAEALVNQALVDEMGWDNPIGKEVTILALGPDAKAYVVGVLQNTHYYSLHHAIAPQVFINFYPINTHLSVRLQPGQEAAALAALEGSYKTVMSTEEAEWQYLSQTLADQYLADDHRGKVFSALAVLALVISLMGLFGLVSFHMEQRQAEVGIRKVNGAMAWDIYKLVVRRYVVLALAALVVAGPLTYLAAADWLSSFAYRMPWAPWPFVLGFAVLLGATVATVSHHALRMTRLNPVKVLKDL